MIAVEQIEGMIGADALDARGERIGEIGQVYVDEQTDRPTWVSVRLGLLTAAEVLVPLEGAEWDERALHLAVDRDVARGAPRKEMDEPLTVGEEERLYTHYGIPTIRHPRQENDLLGADVDDVCYSVHDDEPSPRSGQWALSRAS